MSDNFEKRTIVNISEKASLIWNVATHLVGLYKPHEYGKVILPMTVIKRFSDTLLETKNKVLEVNEQCNLRGIQVKEGFLQKASGYKFYNTSPFTLEKLLDDADNIEENFRSYLSNFSDNVVDILENFDFDKEITKLAKGNALYVLIQEFCTEKAYMGADKISSIDMGYIFEELVRKFSESYDENAGAHFTSRDIIYLMTDLLIAGEEDDLCKELVTKTAYDMAMGTSQMLGCLTERIQQLNPLADITCFGQEFNPETFAIAKSDMLIKGGNADNMKFGDTLIKNEYAVEGVKGDQFEGYKFDYIISNPPFGIDWKKERESVEKEANLGEAGRFGVGIPPVSDGQMLFMLNGLSKLKDDGKMAIIQSCSSLDNGEPESGVSNIRKHLIENDFVDAIIKLPMDLFYNTPISTCIWLISKQKEQKRVGKIQLIDATNCYVKKRKNIGDKKVELNNKCIKAIVKSYKNFETTEYIDGEIKLESKIFNNEDFRYYKLKIEQPLVIDGVVQMKKGIIIPDNSLSETEEVYFRTEEDCKKYFDENLRKFYPNGWINFKKSKIGYGIPFTKLFYHETDMIEIADDITLLEKIEENYKNLKNLLSRTPELESNPRKKSEVGWIGEVPEDWEIHKVKNHFFKDKYIVGKKADSYERLALTMNGVIKRSKEDSDGLQPSDFEGYQLLQPKDLVFKMIDLQNISTSRVGLSQFEGIVSPAYIRLRAKETGVPEYAYYYFMSMYYNNIFNKSGSDGIRSSISGDDMLNFAYPVPSKSMQIKIAKYLDTEIKSIDDLIKDQEEIIEKLKNYKKALTYEVVTGKRRID